MGKASDRFDEHGREKVQCRKCHKWFHRLDVHLKSRHGITVRDYSVEYPDAPTISEAGRLAASEAQGGKFKGTKAAGDEELFKFGVARLRQRRGLDEAERMHVPLHDEQWIPGPSEQKAMEELALGIQDGDNVLIVGPPGIGKSTLVRQMAAICDQPLRRASFHGEVRIADIIGQKQLLVDETSGQTVTSWVDGVIPDAAAKGHWVLIDEIDGGPPHVMFVLHPVLEKGSRSLTLLGDAGRTVAFHEHFRFIATANTLGYGDDSGLYAGTGPLNEAFLDRFGVVIELDYPSAETEAKILEKRSGISNAVAIKMVALAKQVRDAQKNETCMCALSPRRLIAWSEKTVRLNDVRRAAAITITNKLNRDDRRFVDGLVQRHFGGKIS